jgi:hypothetical protein
LLEEFTDDGVLGDGNLAFSHPAAHKTNIWYEGCGSSWTTIAPPMAMMIATLPSMRSVLLRRSGGLPLRPRLQAKHVHCRCLAEGHGDVLPAPAEDALALGAGSFLRGRSPS